MQSPKPMVKVGTLRTTGRRNGAVSFTTKRVLWEAALLSIKKALRTGPVSRLLRPGAKENSMRAIFTLTLLSTVAVGCISSVHRGSVAMKISDSEAHIAMGADEVKAGDRVVLFRNDCERGGQRPKSPTCRRRKLGGGTVTEILNQDYSVVKVDKGVEFEEGVTVERE